MTTTAATGKENDKHKQADEQTEAQQPPTKLESYDCYEFYDVLITLD